MDLMTQNFTITPTPAERVNPPPPIATNDLKSVVNGVVIHYHEIALKLGNRRFFEMQLRRNILRATNHLGVKDVLRLSGRMLCLFSSSVDEEKVIAALQKVFGIAYFAPAVKLEQEVPAIKAV